jgi:hypothetical protein
MDKICTKRRTYPSATGNKLIDRAVNIMTFEGRNVSKQTIGQILAYLVDQGPWIGMNKELAEKLDVSPPPVNHGVVILLEYGLITLTKQLGERVLTVDRERLANPSSTRVCIVHKHQIPTPPPVDKTSTKKIKPRERCSECGAKTEKFEGTRCPACSLRESVNNGTLEVIKVRGRV